MCIKETIRQSLIHWRNKSGLSQRNLSDMLSCCLQTYQSYEEGRAIPSVIILIELRDIYGLSNIDELIYREEAKAYRKNRADNLHEQYLKASPEGRRTIHFILNYKNK
jgi:transcriptional regulator with XRE-family HTH domain